MYAYCCIKLDLLLTFHLLPFDQVSTVHHSVDNTFKLRNFEFCCYSVPMYQVTLIFTDKMHTRWQRLTIQCRTAIERYLRFGQCLLQLNFWHRSFTFNSNKSPTWCNNFSVYYPDVCLELNMFRAFSRQSSGAQWLQWQPLVLSSYRGDSRAVFVVGPAGCNVKLRCQKVNP